MSVFDYKEQIMHDIRKEETEMFLCNTVNVNNVPIILEISNSSSAGPLTGYTFQSSRDHTIGQFVESLLGNSGSKDVKRWYLYYDNVYIPRYVNVGKLYDKYKDGDGYLYMKYSNSHSFGKRLSDWGNRTFKWIDLKMDEKNENDKTNI